MNGKKRSDKDLLQLGLPPMELAERNVNEKTETNNGWRKWIYPLMQKFVTIIILGLFIVGSFIVLLSLLQNYDTSHSTEIIVISGVSETTSYKDHSDVEIFLQLRNKSSQTITPIPKKRKKRHAPTSPENNKDNSIHLNPNQIQKVREIIMTHDRICKEESKNEICKELVSKIKYIMNHEESDERPHEKGNSEIKQELDVISSTEKLKRETKANTLDLLKPSVIENRDSYSDVYEVPNQVNSYYGYPHPGHGTATDENCLLARLLKQNYPNIQGMFDSSGPGAGPLAPPYDNHALPYSRYSPTGSLLQNREVDIHNHRLHPQDAEIFKKYLNTGPESRSSKIPFDTSASNLDCPPDSIACASSGECITQDKWCDGNVDCSDVSDETQCSCKSRVDKSRLCDGYFDCPFGEDEMGCNGCSDTSFSCGDLDMNSEATCFTKEQRCNNIPDCPNQKDEIECTILAPSLQKEPLFAVSNTEGFLHRNFKGTWYAVCKNPYMWAHDACRRETGLIIRPPFIQTVQIDPMLKMNYLNTGHGGLIHTSESCFNSSAVYVTCPDLLCGTRVLSTSQLLRENAAVENHLFGRNKRFLLRRHPYPFMFYGNRMKREATEDSVKSSIDARSSSNRDTEGSEQDVFNETRDKRVESRVVGGKPSKPTSWPWMVAMYRNGMFHCGGVVITQSWVMSAAHCVQEFWKHYFEIQVGMLRRFSFSPQEQNHRVTHIIVNKYYNHVDMKNDLSLLRVQPAIQFSRWVRPICLPGPETAGADWLDGPAPGTMCTAVGWGATVEHGPDPDHMREVEVPVWARCKHTEDQVGKELCAGLAEGGRDACQGDSGGPLLCRNPLDPQQWYMAGIVSHGDGCGRKGEPGVYTRVSLFVKWIRYHILSKNLPTIQPKQECPGFKCISGIAKCIPNKRVCDKIIDCLDGEDELNCNPTRSTPFLADLFSKANSRDSNFNMDDNEEIKRAQSENLTETNTTFEVNDDKVTVPSTTVPLIKEEKLSTTRDGELNHSISSEDTLKIASEIDSISSSNKAQITDTTNDFMTRGGSEEQVTGDPNRSAISEELEESSRGDINTITVPISKEILETRSSTLERKEKKDADIQENWTDADSSNSQHIDSSTNTVSVKMINKENDEHKTTDTVTENNHLSEKFNHPIQNLTEQPSSQQKEGNVETFNHSNEGPESKDLLVNFETESHPTMSPHINLNVENNVHKETEIPDNDSTNESPAKHLVDEDKSNKLVNKVKDLVAKLLPAKIRTRHRIPKEFECRRIYQSVPYFQRCDHKADCEDGTDELGCTCNDFLFTFDRKLICDGIFDCADGQDEADCYNCPEDHFLCKRSELCLPMKHVCDGKPECPQGEDELDCFALTNGKNLNYDFDGKPKISLEGFLTKKHVKDWHVVCEDNLTPSQQEQAASHICRYLGFSSANRYLVKYINVKEDEILKTSEKRYKRETNEAPIHFEYRKVEDGTARHIVINKPQLLKEECVPNITKACKSLYVYCDHSLYTDFEVTQELLYNREAESEKPEPLWPWAAKVYVQGQYKCTGVLVDPSWVVVSHTCLWDSLLSHHVTVVLGSYRTLNSTPGMYEQIYQVDAKKDIYQSKVILLHLKRLAEYSSMVKPMILHSFHGLDLNKTNCVAVGQDENNTTISVFVDEVNENCDLNTLCFQKQRQGQNNCNMRHPWAGIISCHTDQGWYPAASFVETGQDCDMKKIINGTEIKNLKSIIKHFNVRVISDPNDLITDDCDGQRCGRGECIKLSKVCDGVMHCSDGKDESDQACQKKNKICSNKPYNTECECSSGQLKCHNGKCVAKELYHNGQDDCGDGSDEPEHSSCSHYLSRVKPSRLCDGVLHCKDRSDEDPMYCKCFAKKNYRCRNSGELDLCVATDMVCDGVDDCPNGDDEHTCIALKAPTGSPYGTGLVIARSHGVWHLKCYPKASHTKSELESICRELGFISGHAKQLNPPENDGFLFNNVAVDPFSKVQLNNRTTVELRNSDLPIARAIVDNSVQNCYPVFIECL